MMSVKSVMVLTALIYATIHLVFYSHTEWLNTDYQGQIFSIAKGGSWFFVDGQFTSRVPPILPIVFGLTLRLSEFSGIDIHLLAKVLNLGFISLNAYLLYKISGYFLQDRYKSVASFVYLLNPVILYYSFKPLSEHLFMIFFLLFLYYMVGYLVENRGKHLSWAMFFFSLSLLVRPTYLYFTLLLFLFLIYYNFGHLTRMVMPSLVWTLTLLPWIFYCYDNSKQLVLSSSGSIQSLKDGTAYDNKGYRGELTTDPEVRRVMDEFWINYSDYTSTGQVFNYYLAQLQSNPWGLIKFQILKIVRVFYGTDTINKKSETGILLVNLPASAFLLFWFYRVSFNSGRTSLDIFFLILILYTILISSIVVPLFRYMMPVFYLIPILGLSKLTKSIKYE